ncbi:hypothetical protein BCR33DRAFT_711766 [Rhizoclosmatium globosum]|uniref:Zn(2)-C6 fungal-type domain-containing protein n=1 Tax=Rhizoclosmatium globosum TaxID=329046 RepID=A0A1Y2CZJ4_9FUNG|nr:hypothetical protein BCR33DRAFT_711766 [Rhizoclosmatium globosum]|eukprot:ORY52451.1 hypothetical protein BCR33DRAFT_711766 [Rhizoclosmatium globosum]
MGEDAPTIPRSEKPKACLVCYTGRKKCDMAKPSCERCTKRGITCDYNRNRRSSINGLAGTLAVIESGVPCERCKKHHRKCDQIMPTCSLCAKSGVSCEYILPSPIAASSSSSASTQPPTQISGLSVTSPPMSISALSPVGLEPQYVGDPDLYPTFEDYALMVNFFAVERYSLINWMDSKSFLESFFFVSPALRLTWCTIAAYMQTPRLPDIVCFNYYDRAKKAAIKYSETPSLKTLQALLLLAFFSMSSGQPMVAQPLACKAISMLIALRLDVDSDDSSDLNTIQLSDKEKEERRITFWVCLYTIKMLQISVPKWNPIQQVEIRSNRVKPAKKPNPLTQQQEPIQIATVCYLSACLEVIHKIVRQHSSPPKPQTNIIFSHMPLQKEVQNLKYLIPDNILIHENRAVSVAQFLGMIMTNSGSSRYEVVSNLFDTIMISVFYNATVCLLYRPQLYLTGFLKIDSPELLQPDAIPNLLNILDSSIVAARCITQINSWVVRFPIDRDELHLRHWIWKEHLFAAFALFEAAVCLWFATCRTRRWWWRDDEESKTGDALVMDEMERREIRAEVEDVLKTLRELESVFTVVTPMITCLLGMLREMEEVELEYLNGDEEMDMDEYFVDDDMNSILIGMQLVVLDDVGNMQELVEEPWCFLGLLGCEVDNGLRWNSAIEAGWRRYWRSHFEEM